MNNISLNLLSIEDKAYKDNLDLEEITIPDEVESIGESAFEGCKNLRKIILPKSLKFIGANAFKNCTSLEEIIIPDSLQYYSYGLFHGCTNLKRIQNPSILKYIEDFALADCTSLEEFNIPETTTSIGYKALYGCNKIKEIHIPKATTSIEVGAFANMLSLEKITVDEDNPTYLSDEDIALLDKEGFLLQYAINSPNDEYIIGYYLQKISSSNPEDHTEINAQTYNIADYAFENAKNLRKIYINSELESIGKSTFRGCNNLDELTIFFTSYGNSLLIHTHKLPYEATDIPFKKINIADGVTTLCGNIEEIFSNAEEVTLPKTLETINTKVFTKSKKLKKLVIPPSIKSIYPNTFNDNTTLVFEDFGEVPAKLFSMLQTKTELDYYLSNHAKENVRIFSLKDGTYYVKINNYDTVKIKKSEIDAMSNSSNQLSSSPDKFLEFLITLLHINAQSHDALMGIWQDKRLEELFKKFSNDTKYVEELANDKISQSIKEIIENSGIKDEFVFSGLLMRKASQKDLIKIIANYNLSISRYFRLANQSQNDDDLNIDDLIDYCNLLEKYQRYDRIFYNPVFYKKVSKENQELIIKYYNRNIKRLLINSKTLNDTYGLNLNDLLNLCRALGIFSDDEILSQKLTTFLNEKIINEDVKNPIVGNTIHTIFGDIIPREDIDYEFIEFFLENYEALINEEFKASGLISRTYNSFREISKTSTSHRGEQRHLKVTFDKCLEFFLLSKFEGITEENKSLAQLLQKFYSEKSALIVAEKIVEESKKAPTNIFEGENLKEIKEDDFTYEWLPKQDYENLVLGKYCNCCAHLLGAGAGIMRASMTRDDVQNLVIRNSKGEIIGKMTLYVNKELGYGVYNTAEININYRSNTNLKRIYDAFIRGTEAFIERYNKTNSPIKEITIGAYRNALENSLPKKSEVLPTPDYSENAYYVDNKLTGTYNGDSKTEQLLVYKKEV